MLASVHRRRHASRPALPSARTSIEARTRAVAQLRIAVLHGRHSRARVERWVRGQSGPPLRTEQSVTERRDHPMGSCWRINLGQWPHLADRTIRGGEPGAAQNRQHVCGRDREARQRARDAAAVRRTRRVAVSPVGTKAPVRAANSHPGRSRHGLSQRCCAKHICENSQMALANHSCMSD